MDGLNVVFLQTFLGFYQRARHLPREQRRRSGQGYFAKCASRVKYDNTGENMRERDWSCWISTVTNS